MRISQEITAGVALLLGLQLLTSFAGIGLFARMPPVIHEILHEEMSGLVANERLLILAARPSSDPAHLQALRRGIREARLHASDSTATPLIETLQSLAPRVAEGDPQATEIFIDVVRDLSAHHRDQMREADHIARQRGIGGAWSAALLGMGAFAMGLIIHRRLRLRLELPILEVDATLAAGVTGDLQRRAVQLPGPDELHQIMRNLNTLLDQSQRRRATPADPDLRVALLYLLDTIRAPTALVREGEEVVALNLAAVDLWDDPKRAEQVGRLLAGGSVEGWDPVPLKDGLVIWTRSASDGNDGRP